MAANKSKMLSDEMLSDEMQHRECIPRSGNRSISLMLINACPHSLKSIVSELILAALLPIIASNPLDRILATKPKTYHRRLFKYPRDTEKSRLMASVDTEKHT